MVVLSACQSGQGKATSEGLYGLQRAFKKAGVGTMVMALWSVSDKVATEFMTAFYEQLASKRKVHHSGEISRPILLGGICDAGLRHTTHELETAPFNKFDLVQFFLLIDMVTNHAHIP